MKTRCRNAFLLGTIFTLYETIRYIDILYAKRKSKKLNHSLCEIIRI